MRYAPMGNIIQKTKEEKTHFDYQNSADFHQNTSYIAKLSLTLSPGNFGKQSIRCIIFHRIHQITEQPEEEDNLIRVSMTRFIIFGYCRTRQSTKKLSWVLGWACIEKGLVVNQALRHEIPKQKHMMRSFCIFHHHD
jgi:hypothetical protein